MTDEEKLKAAQELDAAYARAEAFDREREDESDERELDGYGHMTWTVGNEDWIACFDAIRVADGIAYHVVVNCESGGFIETTEDGTVPVEEAVAKLAGLPWSYADTFFEQDYSSGEWELPTREEIEETASRWRKHLEQLAAEPAPEPDEEPSDEYGELRRAALNHRGEP